MNNLIYKEDAIKVINDEITIEGIVTHYEAMRDAVHQAKKIYNKRLEELPPAESKIIRCRYCKYWNEGSCNCPDIRVDCSDYYVGDIVTEEDFYCGFAKRREDE